MKRARKKPLVIRAFRLGEKKKEIEELEAKGLIRELEDGSFEVFSLEACNGAGEIAYPGDYIKLDSFGRPYPNRKKFFEENHRHLEGDKYEQISKDLMIWTAQDEMCPEVAYLIEEKGLVMDTGNPEHYFEAPLWGTVLSAASDAVIVFYKIERDSQGEICDAEFNFVERKEFEHTYEPVPEKEPVTYDAFISYSHSEPDAFVAKKLHSMLEHYRVPKKIQELSGKKKIDRVFRDREELQLSSDLAAHISEALEHSEYLIVICSPRSLASEWVQREIRTFLMTHKREQVLTLLAEGEPEDAFPEILCYEEEQVVLEDGTEETVRKKIEPMAADVRGKDRQEIEKKLKGEFLRLLAPMLSCTYDTLKQRHRDYIFRRALAAVSAVAVLAVAFTIYAFQQAAAIDQQYQAARRNQARYLSEISGELLETGDRMGALKTALAVLPEDENTGEAVVPEQMYALNNALYSYRNTGRVDFKVDRSYEMEGSVEELTRDKSQMLSPEGTAYFCLDQMGNAYVLDTESGECIWKICPEDLEKYEDGKFIWIAPISEEEAVLVSVHEIRRINWREKRIEQTIRAEEGDAFFSGYGAFVCTVNRTQIALGNSNTVWVYDLEREDCIQKVRYAEDPYDSYSINSLCFGDDGGTLVIGVSDGNLNDADSSEKGLLLLSVEDGSVRTLSSDHTVSVFWMSNGTIAAIHYQDADVSKEYDERPEQRYYAAVYHPESAERLWTSEGYNIRAYSKPCTMMEEDMLIDEEVQRVLAIALKDRLLVVHPETGEVYFEKTYPTDIVGIEVYDENRYLIGLSDGQISLAAMNNVNIGYGVVEPDYTVGDISSEISSMLYCKRQDCVIQSVSDSRNVVFSRTILDEQMTPLSMEKEIKTVKYLSLPKDSGESEIYRCVICDEQGDNRYSGVSIYKAGEAKSIYEYACEGEYGSIDDIQAQWIDGTPCMILQGKTENMKFVDVVDLSTGKLLSRQQESEDETWWNSDISSLHEKEQVVVYDFSQFAAADITKEGILIPDEEQTVQTDGSIWDIQISKNDRYAAILLNRDDTDWVKVWDMKEESWREIQGETAIAAAVDYCGLGQEASVLAVYTKEGTIDIFDLEEGILIQSLPVGNFDQIDFKFMNHDKYLVVCGERQYLSVWDIETGEVRMVNEDTQKTWGDICVDESPHYFGLVFQGMVVSDDTFYTSQISMYYMDDEGRFYHYADVPYGYASFEAGEILVKSAGGYYSRFYDYQELKTRAEQVLDGEILSSAEKRQYFLSE